MATQLELELISSTPTSLTMRIVDPSNEFGYTGWFSYYLGDEFLEYALMIYPEDDGSGSQPFTISGLSPGTYYYIWILMEDDSYEDPWNGFTTPSSYDLIPKNLVTTRINRGYILKWDAPNDADYYKVRDKLSTASSYVTVTVSDPTRTRTGRKCCKVYDIGVQAFYGNGTSSTSDDIGGGWYFNYSITIPPPQITIESTTVNSSVVSVEWDLKVTANDEIINIYCSLVNSSGKTVKTTVVELDTSTEAETGTLTFYDVPAGAYTVKIYTGFITSSGTEIHCLDDDGDLYIDTATITVSNRPEDWSWSIGNSSATATATKAAYTAITTKGSVSDFKYTVWNDMVAKTAEFLEYLGDSDTAVGTNIFGFATGLTLHEVLEYAEMDSTKDGRTLTATRFNALNCVICKITSGTGISQVVKGGTVCGWYFTTLMTALNSIT